MCVVFTGRCCSPCCAPCIIGLAELLKWLAKLPLRVMKWVCHRGEHDEQQDDVIVHEAKPPEDEDQLVVTKETDSRSYGATKDDK